MRIEALQYRTEDKQDIIIVVDFYGTFPIEEAVLKAWELLKPNLNEIDAANV